MWCPCYWQRAGADCSVATTHPNQPGWVRTGPAEKALVSLAMACVEDCDQILEHWQENGESIEGKVEVEYIYLPHSKMTMTMLVEVGDTILSGTAKKRSGTAGRPSARLRTHRCVRTSSTS